MLKNISNLGSVLSKSQQQPVNGGQGANNQLCEPPISPEAACIKRKDFSCCLIWD